ncbi:hypothetical protein BO94DRAFT_424253, partial [Aspergillus sclerotioniger CBS 115572]
MHKLVVPKQTPAHRFASKFDYAGVSLYRALLRQCGRLPEGAPDELNLCKPYIQNRFHRYKDLQSPSQTANCLKVGYQALDILHAASQCSQVYVNRIKNIITKHKLAKQRKAEWQAAVAKARPPKIVGKLELRKRENVKFQQSTAKRHPDAEPILSRPRPVVSGIRRIPQLVNARGIPFLRIKKPQPKFLSAVINSKLERRWKRMERLKRLETELPIAIDEDAWDALTGHEEEATWAEAVEVSLKEVQDVIAEGDRKVKETAEAMWNIVLEERKLAEAEAKQ